ncbi:unnamed protein product, partial [Polarella glacialis]
MLEGQLEKKTGSGSLTGFWWSLDANEVSGTWSATRMDPSSLERLIEPKMGGEEPYVTKITQGCRLTADGLNNKGKPMCPQKHPLVSVKGLDDDEEEGSPECSRCSREFHGTHWHCSRCDIYVCTRCEKGCANAEMFGDERQPMEVAVLDHFKILKGKVYFEMTVQKVGEGGLVGLVWSKPDDNYIPGEDLGTWASSSTGIRRHSGADAGKGPAWKDNAVIGFAVDREAGTVLMATLDLPIFQPVLQLTPEQMPQEGSEQNLLLVFSPGEKGALVVNAGQMPFQLKAPTEQGFRPLAEIVDLRTQWRVTLPDNVETWPVYLQPSRQADGTTSLGPKDSFEELEKLVDAAGVHWVRHSRGWSPVSLEALGRACDGLAALPSIIDALEKRGDPNGFRFFRFLVTKARGGDTVNGVSIGQLLLRKDGLELDLSSATAQNPEGACSDGEGPEKAIDGRTSTKWCTSLLTPLVVALAKPALIDSFSFRTAHDGEQLDPVEWRLEASTDSHNWKVLHSQEKASYHTPRRRSAQTSWFDVSGGKGSSDGARKKLIGWTSGARVKAGTWHAVTLAVDLPRSSLTVWLDGEVALEIIDASNPMLRCEGPLSLDPEEGLCLFGRKPLLKKEWGWMLGAQLRRLQLQTQSPHIFNVWAQQMPMGVWICRAPGTCKTQSLFTRNAASADKCWRCKSARLKSGYRPPGDIDPRHPGITVFTVDSFEELLERKKCVFLVLTADWCGACQNMKSGWYALANLLRKSEQVTVGIMNIDENQADRKYFPENHIPVIKLLTKPIISESENTESKPSDRATCIAFEGRNSLPDWLQFLHAHTGLVLEDVLSSNYESYSKEFGVEQMLTTMANAARQMLRDSQGAGRGVVSGKLSARDGSAQSWRRLCDFLYQYCLDPLATDDKKASTSATSEDENELWITLLLRRLREASEAALKAGQPREPLAFLRREVFLQGARPEAFDAVLLGFGDEGQDAELEAGEDFASVPRPTNAKKWSQRWSAVAQQKASARAEPMALPMLQRSWSKVKAALDTQSSARLQLLRDLLLRGLDLDFRLLGDEQPSVLWLAAANDDVEVLRFCLASGADPHREAGGVLPVEAAASSGATQSLSLLLRSGVVVGRAVHFAAAASQLGALRALVSFKADSRLQVNGLSALAIAAALGHDEAAKLLLTQTWGQELPVSPAACQALGLLEGSGALQLAALCGRELTCELLQLRGFRSAADLRTLGSTGAQERVRSVLEPQRWLLLRSLADNTLPNKAPGSSSQMAGAFATGLASSFRTDSGPQDAAQRAVVVAGVGLLRPRILAALLDDAEALALLGAQGAADPLAPSPTPLMWAQWAGAQASSRQLLDAGQTLSNADLEGLRRLGRARRLSQDSKVAAAAGPSASAQLLEPGNWEQLPKAAQLLASTGPAVRIRSLRQRMTFGGAINPDSLLGSAGVASSVPPAPIALNRLSSETDGEAEGAEEAAIAQEAAAVVLLQQLGAERASWIRFLVQREIARGEGRASMAPAQLCALQAVANFADVHAECHTFMPVLRAALMALPACSGPCYRSLVLSDASAETLSRYKPGSMVRWALGTAATRDFGAAMDALASHAELGSLTDSAPRKGILFKVRRTLSARQISEESREVLFLGGSLRVVGLFALAGPLLAAERQLAAASCSAATALERLGP